MEHLGGMLHNIFKICTQHQDLNADVHYVHGFKTFISLPVELRGFAVVFKHFAFIIG